MALAAAKAYQSVEEMLERAGEKGEPPLIVICDGINDPQNLGAILRTAEACGAHGVIIPKHRSVGLTAAAGKASAGAMEYIPVARVVNLAAAIEDLKARGLWVFGADMEGGKLYYEENLSGPAALVIGSEGGGIGRLVKDKCDFLVRIPMRGRVSSLNASVAGAVILYEAMRQRSLNDNNH